MAAVVAFTPLNVWLVWSALHGRRGPTQLWGLVGLVVLAYGLLPLIGHDWMGMSGPVAALALVLPRAPWSWLAFAAVVATRWPIAHALGHPEFSLYGLLAAMNVGIGMAVLIWLIGAARRLEAARVELAEAAVVREREQLDASLRETVGAALREIRTGAEWVRRRDRAAGRGHHHHVGVGEQQPGFDEVGREGCVCDRQRRGQCHGPAVRR